MSVLVLASQFVRSLMRAVKLLGTQSPLKLDLDARAIEFFEDEAWFTRLPNAEDFTVRDLLRHQTGMPRHVFQPEFFPDCMKEPDRVWKPRELLSYVFDEEPRFPAFLKHRRAVE